jgi:hypothetical protein
MSSPTLKLSILLPVRNEGMNLKIMLKMLSVVVEVPHEIIVVHDTLDDDSIPVVTELNKKYTRRCVWCITRWGGAWCTRSALGSTAPRVSMC